MQKKLKVVVVFIFLMVSFLTSFSQSRIIKGKVKDHEGVGVVGANVVIKGSSSGTVTNVVGDYLISATGTIVLVVSFTGCTTKEVTVNAGVTSMDIVIDCSGATPEQWSEILKMRKKHSLKKEKAKQ